MMPSTVEHLKRGVCLISPRTIVNRKTFGAHNGLLVSTDLSRQLLKMKEYGEGTMTVNRSSFKPCALVPSNVATVRCGVN